MKSLPQSLVIGSWWIARSTSPRHWLPGQDFYHFTPDGWYFWEWPLAEPWLQLIRFRYTMTEGGVFIRPAPHFQRGWEVPLSLEDGMLVVNGSEGNRAWLQRILPTERPLIMSRFYEAE
jgi:hypothetical protein